MGKFLQLHYLLSQNIGGTKHLVFLLVQKLVGNVPVLLKLSPCYCCKLELVSNK